MPLPREEPDAWDSYWASFERALRAEAASPLTLRSYRRAGEQFRGFLDVQGWPADPTATERRWVEEFLIHLQDEGYKANTIRQRFSILHRFFGWLEAEEGVRTPMLRMRTPKVDEPPPPFFTEDQQRQLVEACQGTGFEARRDAAIIRLMLDSGVRSFEVCGMLLENLRLDEQEIGIMGKGSRAGTAYFGAKAARDLDRYLRLRARHPYSGLPNLWLTRYGALTNSGLAWIIRQRAEQIGISGAHPHLTRHSWAHAMKAAGASDEDTMTLGRWKDARVMRRYGESAAQARARQTHRRLSPGDRL